MKHHLDDPAPTNPSPEWEKMDALVKLWLYGTLHSSLLQMILKKGWTANIMWTSLESLFRDNKDARAIELENDLRSIEIGDLSVAAYYQKIKVTADLLSNIDQPVLEKTLVMYMINGLGEKFDQVVGIIRHQQPLPSFFQVRSMLLLERSRLAGLRPTHGSHRDNSSSPSALVTGSGQ